MSKETYFKQMGGWASEASKLTGIPKEVILAQWGLETGFGSSTLAKYHNNHAGIKATSRNKDYIATIGSLKYAGYNSMSAYIKDYARVMGLSYYDKVRSAGSIDKAVIELHRSPWAEDPNYDDKLFKIIKGSNFKGVPSKVSEKVEEFTGIEIEDVKERFAKLTESEKVKMGVIGLGVVMLVAINK
jgi:flagellum-specific peptidoglycan hydrolase FlgJ